MDIASSEMLDSALRSLVQRSHGRIIVDLSRVTFMDSAGLRALVRARERMDVSGRWLVTRGATGQPRRLLDIGRVRYGLTL
jgi:anti-sigma B factor antagonist